MRITNCKSIHRLILIFLINCFFSHACLAESFGAEFGISNFGKNFHEGAFGSPLALLFTTLIIASIWVANYLCRKITDKIKELSKVFKLDRSILSQLDAPEIKISNDDIDDIDRLWKGIQKFRSYLTIVYGLPTMFGMLGTVSSLIASNLSRTEDLAGRFSIAIVSTALGIIAYIIIRFMYLSQEQKIKELERNIALVVKKKTLAWEQ